MNIIQTQDKYTNLLEDYTELKQTNDACREEYLRVYEQNKQLKNTLDEIKKILIPTKKVTNNLPKKKVLTKRQQEIMENVAKGLSNEEIAEKMNLTVSGVKIQVHNILDRLGVKNRLKAVLIYFKDYRDIDFGDFLF